MYEEDFEFNQQSRSLKESGRAHSLESRFEALVRRLVDTVKSLDLQFRVLSKSNNNKHR